MVGLREWLVVGGWCLAHRVESVWGFWPIALVRAGFWAVCAVVVRLFTTGVRGSPLLESCNGVTRYG